MMDRGQQPRKQPQAGAGPRQITTRRCTMGSITGSRDFQRGVADYIAGRDLPLDTSWKYERGRQYAACCKAEGREPQCSRVGRELNYGLVFEVGDLMDRGDIL